jgi:uncharacterized membrane protein
MARREITERDREWLVGELSVWAAQGLIGEEQSARIIDLYQTPEELGRHRSDRGIHILSGLAALLVGLAVLLLIGFNWDALPDPLKLAVVFTTIAATHWLGFLLRYREKRPAASEIAFFLACMFFGGGIWLVAQVFNISSSDYGGLWWWALGILPFALILDGVLLHALMVGLLGLYLLLSIRTSGLLAHGSWRVIANSYMSIPVISSIGLLWAYRWRSPRAVGLYVALFFWWTILQPFAWGYWNNPVYFIGCIGCLLLIIAECHTERSPLAVPYRLYGVALVGGVLLPLSYPSFHSTIDVAEFSPTILVEMTAVLSACVLAVALSAEFRRRVSRTAVPSAQVSQGGGRRLIPPVSLAVSMGAVAFWEVLVHEPIIPTILANLAMLALAFWLIMLGLRQDRGRPFMAGVLYFLLWSMIRYLDLFGDLGGMLGAAAMFFLCGAALFGLARFWQHRQSRSVAHEGT